MDEAIQMVVAVMGKGLFLSLGIYTLIFSVNFMYISARGIKKLDAYFEDGKDYDDTWSFSASSRFFDYCWNFIRGRLKVSDHDIRWWMYFNAIGYLLTCGIILLVLLAYCYIKIIGWIA